MNIPFFSKKQEEKIDYKPSIYVDRASVNTKEEFKGEVETNKVKFPQELGEEHPFDFKQLEDLYKKFGFFAAVVDKYVDFIVGPGFYVDCKEARAKEIIENFMKDVNLDTVLRQWSKEALIKGNGFLEIGGDKKEGVKGLKLLNANNMYVVRDNKGKILRYNQYRGGFKDFNMRDMLKQKKVINFDVNQIAHVPFNIIGDSAYGLGIGYPAMKFIDNWLSDDKELRTIMKRKANAPLHAKFGFISGDGSNKIIPKEADIQAFGKNLEIMSNKTEWVTDPLVELKVVDFGRFDQKIATSLENDLEMLIYAFQIPAVVLGKANVPEGLAKVQMEAFQRRIQSIQAELEKIIEEKIFKRVLNANGFDVHVEFEWGTPSVMEVEGRMKLIADMMKSPTISPAMNNMLEDEMINLLSLDKDEWQKMKLEQEQKQEEERKRLETQSQPQVPGQNAKFPSPVQPKSKQPKQPTPQEKHHHNHNHDINESFFDELNDIQEWLGFNYKKYLKQILNVTSAYDFGQLKAVTEQQIKAGYFTDEQVTELKSILTNGFKKGIGMKEMAKLVDKKVKPKDLYQMNNASEIKIGASGLPILSKSADKRAISIVRTEVTRLANQGAVEYYKLNDITQVQWVASYGPRTCPDCEALNGQIFKIDEVPDIPYHTMCRCTLTPVVELK